MSEAVALPREGGRDVSFEGGMSSNASLWWDLSLVPPVLSFTSFGLLSGVGLLSEVLSLALLALLFDDMRMTQLTRTLMTTHQIATLHLTATRKVQITIPETPTTGPTTEEPSTTCLYQAKHLFLPPEIELMPQTSKDLVC